MKKAGSLSRRSLFKRIGLGSFSVSLFSIFRVHPAVADPATSPDFSLDTAGPVNYSLPDQGVKEFSGDTNPEKFHSLLWAKDSLLDQIKSTPVSEIHSLVIVGGGMGGLFSAYLLRDLNPVLLEAASRFGGNAKAENWRGISYGIGAAYFMEQEPSSALHKLFLELGIFDFSKKREGEDPVFLGSKRIKDFWSGDIAPESKAQFQKAEKFFRDVFNGTGPFPYPDIPSSDLKNRELLNRLDVGNFYDYLSNEILKEKPHPYLVTLLEHYCWSTLGASMYDLSAAAVISSYAAEFGGAYVAPAGNASIAERVLQRLATSVPQANLRPSSIVVDVEIVADGTLITYQTEQGAWKKIHAKAAILSCPKFIAAKLIRNLSPSLEATYRSLKYTGYVVANALLRKPTALSFYDGYFLGDGQTSKEVEKIAKKHGVTDVVWANYATPSASSTVLTLFRNLPYANGRSELYNPAAYANFYAETRQQLVSDIFPALGLTEADLVELRLTRWGHPMPVAAPGFFAKGVVDQIRAPIENKVFFVEQDNWMYPAIETSAVEAILNAPTVREAALK